MATTVEQEMTYGLTRLREHWLNQAEIHFRRILAEFPDHAGGLHLLGVTSFRLGRDAEGLALLRRACEQRPDSGSRGLRRGSALLAQHLVSATRRHGTLRLPRHA